MMLVFRADNTTAFALTFGTLYVAVPSKLVKAVRGLNDVSEPADSVSPVPTVISSMSPDEAVVRPNNLFVFINQLLRIGKHLPLASSANAKMTTKWGDSYFRITMKMLYKTRSPIGFVFL